MNDARYFELLDHVGVDIDAETGERILGPLVETGIEMYVPTASAIGLTQKKKRVSVRPFAPKQHPRMTRTNDPVVAAAILATGNYREVDPPKSETSRTRRNAAASAPRIRGARLAQEA